jgi:hypothetical protein
MDRHRAPGAPMYSEEGRMMRLSARCSMMWAAQPVTRENTKSGVNILVGMPQLVVDDGAVEIQVGEQLLLAPHHRLDALRHRHHALPLGAACGQSPAHTLITSERGSQCL